MEVEAADLRWSLPEPDVAVLREAKAVFQVRYPRAFGIIVGSGSGRFDRAPRFENEARFVFAGYSLRVEGDLRARQLAEKIEQACSSTE